MRQDAYNPGDAEDGACDDLGAGDGERAAGDRAELVRAMCGDRCAAPGAW